MSLHSTLSLPALIDREHLRHRRRVVTWSAIGATLAAGALAAGLALRPRPVPMASRFRAQPVTRGDLVREVRATGHVEALSTVSVGAEISGRIATVGADYNDRVRAGQVLARFDETALDAQRVQTQATVAAARAVVAQSRFDLAQARRNLTRSDALHARLASSDQEHDSAETAASLAQARLDAADSQLAAQEAAYALARTNLDHAAIRAPIDGVIITRNIDPGQTVASMLQTPVLFTVAADLRKMRVIAAVDEADIGEVRVGQRASFGVNAYPDRVFEGLVTEVRNSPVVVQDVVTYGCVVEVANPDLALKPGMTASVRVVTATARDVDRVPNAALHFTPPGEDRPGSQPTVFILEGAALRRIALAPGVSDGEWTAIVGGALPPGARPLIELTREGKRAYGLDKHD